MCWWWEAAAVFHLPHMEEEAEAEQSSLMPTELCPCSHTPLLSVLAAKLTKTDAVALLVVNQEKAVRLANWLRMEVVQVNAVQEPLGRAEMEWQVEKQVESRRITGLRGMAEEVEVLEVPGVMQQ